MQFSWHLIMAWMYFTLQSSACVIRYTDRNASGVKSEGADAELGQTKVCGMEERVCTDEKDL